MTINYYKVSTPCKGWNSFTSNTICPPTWPRMFYEHTLYSLRPPSETGVLHLLLLLLLLTCMGYMNWEGVHCLVMQKVYILWIGVGGGGCMGSGPNWVVIAYWYNILVKLSGSWEYRTYGLVWLYLGPLCFENVGVLEVDVSWKLVVKVCHFLFSLVGWI